MRIALASVQGDLRLHPGRALLMAVAVLIGTAAVAAAFVAANTLGRAIPDSFGSSLPPDAVILTKGKTADAMVLLRSTPGVVAVEPRRVLRGRIATPTGFASLRLAILPDLAKQDVSRIVAEDTAESGLLIERSSLSVWGKAPGEVATLRLPGVGQIELPTAGTAADAAVAPGVQDRIVYAYATPEMVRSRGDFDELHLRLEPDGLRHVLATLDAAGIVPGRVETPLQRHPHADQMQAVVLLLVVFAAAAIAVSAALVGNLVAVALRAEVRLVGIQKAIGASTARVVATTVGGVAMVALPAALIGLAVGVVAGSQFVGFAAHELNLANQSLAPSPIALLAALTAGLSVPLLAASVIAQRAARIAPLAAINADRRGAAPRPQRRSGLSVARAYALRHLGRAPLRLMLMLLALSLGGAAVMAAGNVYRSLSEAVDRVFAYRLDDLDLRLLKPAPVADLTEVARVEGVTGSQVWGFLLVSFVAGDTRITGGRFGLLAPPADTRSPQLPVAQGRWLSDPAAMEIVAARSLLARYAALAVGSEVTLARGEARVPVRIVGAIEEATEPGVYATRAVHDALLGASGLAGALRLATDGDRTALSTTLEERLFRNGHIPLLVFDRAELQFATKEHFVILLLLLSTVGGGALIVGSLSLWSSITVSIVERRREVAVIRSIGASNDRVLLLFGMESAGVALMALVLSVAIALPLSAALAFMLGQGVLHIAVPLNVSWVSLALWLVVLTVIVTLATWVPLARALSVPPARALRYE